MPPAPAQKSLFTDESKLWAEAESKRIMRNMERKAQGLPIEDTVPVASPSTAKTCENKIDTPIRMNPPVSPKPEASDPISVTLPPSPIVNDVMTEFATNEPSVQDLQTHIVKNELYDPNVMEALIKDIKTFSKADLGKLSRYKRGRKHGNQVEVVYHYARHKDKVCDELIKADKLGRLYARDGQGLQAFAFDMRNPLLEANYWDCDMENCHYIILEQLARNWGLKTKAIKYYINNRVACLMMISENRGVAKTAFLKIAYGGNIKMYNEFYNDDGIPHTADLTVVRAIEAEMKAIVDMCWSKYEKYHRIVKGKDNPRFSLFALILQTEERKCLMAMEEALVKLGRQMDIYIHDGGEIRKLPNETVFPEEYLRKAEAYIKETLGYEHRIVVKPFKHNFVMTKPVEFNYDDEFACRSFIKLMGSKIKRDGEDVYFFSNLTGMWSCNDTAYLEAVASHKHSLIWKTTDETGKEHTYNYGGMIAKVEAMRKWLLPLLEDSRFIMNNADTSNYKLLFSDGIYDFRTGFTPGFDPSIVFNKRIDRPCPKEAERDEDLIKEINNVLFVNAFAEGNGREAGEYFKKALAIGLAGDYRRKRFYMGVGEADCGKGLTVSAFRASFEGYCCEWNANNLKYNRENGQDEAKKLAWLKKLIGCRLGFSSEVRLDNVKLDGNLLKTLSSGGDEISIRGNHQDEFPIVNRCAMIMLANDMAEVSPQDSGTRERIRVFNYRLRFVQNPVNEDERKADPSLKDKFATKAYKDALFWLMADTFKTMEASERQWGGRLNDPVSIAEATTEWTNPEDGSFKSVFMKRFIVTNKVEDFVKSSSIVSYMIKEKKFNLSPQKLGREVTKLISLPEGTNKDFVDEDGDKCRYGIAVRETNVV